MDYEKAYKASLKTAAQWIKDGCTDKEKICLKCVFPELRESEDERIRMKLFHTVRGTPKDSEWFEEISKEAMLAWLEKQKEASKAIEAVERIDKYIDEHLANAHDMKDSNPEKKYYRGWDDALGKMAGILQDVYSEEKQKEEEGYESVPVESTLEYKLGFKAGKDSEKQKEQKHPDGCFTCDEYKKGYEAGRLHGFTAGYNKAMKEQKPNIELIQRSWYMEGYHDREFGKEPKWIIKTGEGGPRHELNPKYGQPLAEEQKSVEWSKENETSIAVKNPEAYKIGFADGEAYAKEQMQEWSEEDEKILDSLIRLYSIEYSEYVCPWANGDITYGDVVNFLKSLRPSWKPSEEQMNRLVSIVAALRKDYCDDMADFLASLYEQLKKLM